MSVDFKEYKAAFLEQNDLAHFGILGMKWGVRRYQNPDGTLTPAGKRHYYKQEVKKANKLSGVKERGKAADELSKNEYIKEAVDKLKVIDENGHRVGPTVVEMYDMARNLIKSKFLGSYVNGESNITVDAIRKAIEEKYNKDREEYDKKKYENATPEMKKLYDDGWNESREEGFNNQLTKNEKGNDYSLMIDKSTGNYKSSKKLYDSFKKNEKEHVNHIIDEFLKNNKQWLSDWTNDFDKLKKELRSAANAFDFDGKYGLVTGLIGNYGIPELGYHSISIEYDPLTKKLYQTGLEG